MSGGVSGGVGSRWTTAADLRARVRRRWDDGSLLRGYAAGLGLEPIDLPVRGPGPAQIGDDIVAVRAWIDDLVTGSAGGTRYDLTFAEVGGRVIGRNRIPRRAVLSDHAQAWALLGVRREVTELDRILELVGGEPEVRRWVGEHPLRALRVGQEWAGVLAAYRWLRARRGSGVYLRQVDAPGVDTKLIERHRGLLAALLGVSGGAGGFVRDLGLAARPELVRLRVDPALGVVGPFGEAAVRVAELAAAEVRVDTAVVVENEVTFLSLPVPERGVLLWGKGFDVDRVGVLPWLAGADLHYWGDLDTHGFAILHRLRAWLPQTRSFLMDRETLLAHRERWGSEPAPTRAALGRLTTAEAALYGELVTDVHGERVRLEQERVDWAWVLARLPYAGGGPAAPA